MKKTLSLILAAAMVLSMAACGSKETAPQATPTVAPTQSTVPATATPVPTTAPAAETEKTMTYAEYAAAPLDSAVTVYTYFQAAQSWWEKNGEGVATIYTQDKDGGYFLYECKISKEEYAKLVPGTKLLVKGFKSEWAGEVEITDCTAEIVDGDKFTASAEDVTSLLGTDDLVNLINRKVSVKGAAITAPASYKWDGSGTRGDDLYVKLNVAGKDYTFVVESYLCDKDSATYKAVEALKTGDIVDLEGFLYWYNGAQPHITDVKVVDTAYARYASADVDTPVVIYTYFQAAQSWWEKNGEGVATIYTQDKDGGYFLYECKISKDDFAKLVPGMKLRVEGFKAEWAGEVEVSDCALTIVDDGDKFVATPEDITSVYGTDKLVESINRAITVKGLTVSAPATYKWDGSGTRGDDLYLKAKLNGTEYTFVVESYLCGKDTDTYKAVEALKAGNKIDLEGFLYWYNGAQPHITKVISK